MCDEGRLNYRFVNTDRVKKAYIDRGGEKFETSVENGMNELHAVLGTAGKGEQEEQPQELFVLASATCTLEEMYLLKKFAAVYPGASCFVARHVADGEQDDLLRRKDRHSNVKGAELLGIRLVDLTGGADGPAVGVVDEVPESAVLFAVGFDYGIGEVLEKFFGKFAKVVLIASRESALTRMAHVLIPGLTFAEKEGLIVNFEGHIQQLSPALDNLWDRIPPWQLVADLMSSYTGEEGIDSIAGLRDSIGKEEAVFAAVNLNAVGWTGVRLAAQAV
ncbi:MAG: molybdopterin-dependent oxidoreductase [Candidatus Krumholzibacteria bacterium]|nr:molybdopterin-dependent oxidoreductase [Candidatus Krumholzibacteria bacterium]